MVWDKAFRYMSDEPETLRKAKELSSFFEQKVKEIESLSLKDVITKNVVDPNSAVNELKNTTQKY